MSDVTLLLTAIERGDALAAEQLLPLVYDELRRLAASKMSHERPDQTLQATALVHEAFVRLVDVNKAQQWNIAADTSLRRQPKPCGGFWSKTRVAVGKSNAVPHFRKRKLTRSPS